jgi:hypothetical protein
MATAEKGTIFMAGGLPNPTLFPFDGLEVTLTGGLKLKLEEKELKAALQYQATLG